MLINRLPQSLRRSGGFTLLELLLVLVILSVLAGLLLPRFANRAESARIAAAEADIEANLATALELYELDNGRFPSTEQGLMALISEPDLPPRPRKWNGPYLRQQLPAEPWGNLYQYRSPAEHSPMGYDLYSYGPDGAQGGGDDITNWQE